MDRTELEDLLREAMGEVMSNFTIEENDDGELVILTGLAEDPDSDELMLFDAENNEDYDPNTVPLCEDD